MKKKKNVKFLLPGFHTGTDWKMTIAIIYYIIVVLLAMTRGLQKGIILFIALMAAVYLGYGIMGLFAKEKKPVISAVYILISLIVIAGDSVFMNVSGYSVSDIMKSSPAQYTASSSGKSGGQSSKQSTKQSGASSNSKQTASGGSSVNVSSAGGPENADSTENTENSSANVGQMTEADMFNPEEKIDSALNEDVFDSSQNKAQAVQLYYIEKKSMIYHQSADCSSLANKKVYTVTADEVKRRVMIPCRKCVS